MNASSPFCSASERRVRPAPRGWRTRSGAFTLIELLAVIVIIGILMGLLMTAVLRSKTVARHQRAKAEVVALKTAIATYVKDYGKFPLQPSTAGDITYTTASYLSLIKILRADPTDAALLNQWNPRRSLYLEVQESSVVNNALKDPWDNDYFVRADGDFDNKVQYNAAGDTRDIIGQSIIAWSNGAKAADASDNIKSFEE